MFCVLCVASLVLGSAVVSMHIYILSQDSFVAVACGKLVSM